MNNYFQKIDLKLPDFNIQSLKGEFFEGYGEEFRAFYINDQEYVNTLIKDHIQFDIPPVMTSIAEISNYGANPHVDHHSVALNYYVNPANCITIFWEETVKNSGSAIPKLQQDGSLVQNDVKVYHLKDLKMAERFNAEAKDTYLLNVKKIHSANRLKNDGVRSMLRWVWNDVSFEDVLASIKILD
jgi:hypothetical protein